MDDVGVQDKRPIFGNRLLLNEAEVFTHNAWDDVQWNEQQENEALSKVQANFLPRVSCSQAAEYESCANKHWNNFYGTHSNRFFKDRNWLFTEFPELTVQDGESSSKTIFEIGCGVGNTIFPILQSSKSDSLFVYGCDFSQEAINLLERNNTYEPSRCKVFVMDATSQDWDVPFERESIDIIVMIFVISAIRPDKFDHIIKQVHSYLKPGGVVLFRDYGRYDLAQLRFKPGQCLSDNFYVRGDGTRVYFFTEDEIRNLFESNGFLKEVLHTDRRLQVNRGKMLKMYRVWIQAKYRKPFLENTVEEK